MSDTNVRVVFSGSSAGAVRASDQTADAIKKIGREGREAAHGVDEIRERAERGTRAINEERRALERLKVASLLGGAATAGRWGLMAGGIAALGATAVGATAALAPLAGSVAVLPGLLTAAGLALGTVKLAMDNVAKAAAGNKKALAELTPAGRQFVATLKTFEPLIDKLRTTAQKGLFPGLLTALQSLKTPAVFAVLNTAIGEMAKSLGGVAAQFGKVIGSQKFLQTFAVVAQAAAHWMQQFGTFAVKGFDAMISLTKAAIPLTNWMGTLAVRFATFLDTQIKAASASGKLQSFFQGVRQEITLIGQTLGSLGSALISVFRAALPFGNALFEQLGKGADAVKKFADSAKGKEALAGFFQSVSNALRGLAPIAGALLGGIANVLPHLLNALGALGRALGPALVPMLGLAARGLGGLLDVVSRVAGAVGPLIARAVGVVRQHLPGITDAARKVVDYFRTNFLPPLMAYFRGVGAAWLAVVGVIRRNWPQISSIARSIGSNISAAMKVIAAAVQLVAPVVRALGPVFHAAFIVAALQMKAMAAVISLTSKIIVGVLHGIVSAIHDVGDAWHWLTGVAGHVIHFFADYHSSGIPGGPATGPRGVPRRGRAHGGFIPGPAPGAPVPILAHAGEVVLNRAQQDALGGARFLAGMFGFTGDEGPGFAAGGFVGGWRRPKRTRRPSHPLRVRARAASKAGQKAFAAADAFQQRETDMRHTIEQLRTEYEISPDASGSSALDPTEIDALVAKKQEVLALYDQEKAALEKALAALQKAIAALVSEIKAEQAAIAADLRKLRVERGRKRPNRKVVASLEKDVSGRRRVIGKMQGELGLVRGDVTAGKRRHDFDLGFDRHDVELDILDLQEQKREYVAAQSAGGGDSGAGGGGDTGGGGGGGFDNSLIQLLMAELGKLRLALTLQNVQVPVIASFAKGTLQVPETGLYELHAGEQVTPAGRPRGGDPGSIGDIHVNVVMEGDAAGLERFIKVKAVEAAPAIARAHGQEANTRRRGGRY